MTDIDIEAIRARAEAATPGPWERTDGHIWIDTREMVCCGRGQYECCGEPDVQGGQELVAQSDPVNADFIAHARDDIPALLSALEAEKKRADDASDSNLSTAARDVLAERQRQIEVDGWTPEHDDEHGEGDLALIAGSYCESAARPNLFRKIAGAAFTVPRLWPSKWSLTSWKPKNPRADLVRAGALILAEIERLDRAALNKEPGDDAAT